MSSADGVSAEHEAEAMSLHGWPCRCVPCLDKSPPYLVRRCDNCRSRERIARALAARDAERDALRERVVELEAEVKQLREAARCKTVRSVEAAEAEGGGS